MKKYCLNKYAKRELKEFISSISNILLAGIMASIATYSIIVGVSVVVIPEMLGQFNYLAGVMVWLFLISLVTVLSCSWFIKNLEECD